MTWKIHDIEYDDVSELDTWWHVQFDKSFWWLVALINNVLRCGWADWQVYWAEKIERVVCSWVDHAEPQHWRTISSEEIEQQRLNKMVYDQQRWQAEMRRRDVEQQWWADYQQTWWLALMNKLASRLMRLTNSIGQRLTSSRTDWWARDKCRCDVTVMKMYWDSML